MALSKEQIQSLSSVASRSGIELAALAAVINVESAGVIFAAGMASNMPVIRWEGHYFYKFLKGADRDKAVKLGLASPTAGAVKNPSSQDARYKLLYRAAEIDEDAAYSSISVGVGQVMCSHWKALGYTSAKNVFQCARQGLEGQVELMIKFIQNAALIDEIQRRDWSAFARGYNGRDYAKNKYHTKMASAYEAARKLLNTNVASAASMLRLGSNGARVREVQQLLVRAGYSLNVDGDFGPATRNAVKDFQRKNNVDVDGVVGPKTLVLLEGLRTGPDEKIGAVSLAQLPETPAALLSGGGGISLMPVADQLNKVADKIQGAGEVFNVIANGLYIVGGLLLVGGILWGAYGYLKSHQTYEGTA